MNNKDLTLDLLDSTCYFVSNRIQSSGNQLKYRNLVNFARAEILRAGLTNTYAVLVQVKGMLDSSKNQFNNFKYEILAIDHSLDIIRSISTRFH